MNKRLCFEVRVAFNIKVLGKTINNTRIFSKSSVYYIVTDSRDNAMDTAIYLNKVEYGNVPGYQYKGCAISDKKVVYVLNK